MEYEFAGVLYATETEMYLAIADAWLSAGGMNTTQEIAEALPYYTDADLAAECTQGWNLYGTLGFQLGCLEYAFSVTRLSRQ